MKKIATVLLSVALLMPLCVSNAVAETTQPIKIVSFGDSIFAAGTWQSYVTGHTGLNIVNMGVRGENSTDGLKRLPNLLAAKPDIAIIMFGANDTAKDMAKGVPFDTYISNMRTMITACQANGITVIAVMQSYFDAAPYYTRHKASEFTDVGGIEAYMDSYIAGYRELAQSLGVAIADVRSMCDAYAKRSDIIADGVHPNNSGYSLYAKAVMQALREVLGADIDLDGKQSIVDYVKAKRAQNGLQTLAKPQKFFADCDGDSVITDGDCTAIKQKIQHKGE